MLEKRPYDENLSRIRTGGLTVTYWDGETMEYATESFVRLRLRDKPFVRKRALSWRSARAT